MNVNRSTVTQYESLILFYALQNFSHGRTNKGKQALLRRAINTRHLMASNGVVSPWELNAGFLQNILECTDCTLEDIERAYGLATAEYVRVASEDNRRTPEERVKYAARLPDDVKAFRLADLIVDLRTIQGDPPIFWHMERLQDYHAWAYAVGKGLSGVNVYLDAEMEQILKGSCYVSNGDESRFPVLPDTSEAGIEAALQRFYTRHE